MVAKVKLWDKLVGYVLWEKPKGYGIFEFEPSFISNGLDISPDLNAVTNT